MKVKDLGEFKLIEVIEHVIGKHGTGAIQLGIGDDAAAWRSNGSIELCTIDTLVQDIHFNLGNTGYADLGWKALAVNLSDIAAMGGMPLHALVSLSLPGYTEVDDIKKLYEGMLKLARKYDVAIAGGDVVRAPQLTISISVIGRATGDTVLKRSAAAAGDHIAVTGTLGASAAGLQILTGKLAPPDGEAISTLRMAHLTPEPRLAEGQLLAKNGVKAAIDISDGLLGDLGHICTSSAVGAEIYAGNVPVNPLVSTVFKEDAVRLALSGGEDYELLFCAAPQVIGVIKNTTDTQITVIGSITDGHPGEVILLDADGNKIKPDEKGWNHFS